MADEDEYAVVEFVRIPSVTGILANSSIGSVPRPTLQQFFICMTMPETYSKDSEKRAAGELSGNHFQNISIAAPSVLGEPQILWGQADARIRNLTFEYLTLAVKPLHNAAFCKTNEFVDGIIFAPSANSKP